MIRERIHRILWPVWDALLHVLPAVLFFVAVLALKPTE